MRVYTCSEAMQKLSELFNQAQTEEVDIKRRDGTTFSVNAKLAKKSPYDVKGVKAKISKKEIVDAVRESMEI